MGESCFLGVGWGAILGVVLLLLLIAEKRFSSEIEDELGIRLGMSWFRPAWFSSLLYPPCALYRTDLRVSLWKTKLAYATWMVGRAASTLPSL